MQEARDNRNRPLLQENLSKMTSDNFSDSNMKSSLEVRPNVPRLKRLEANYLQRLPVRPNNVDRTRNNASKASTSKGSLPKVRMKIRQPGNINVTQTSFKPPHFSRNFTHALTQSRFRLAGKEIFGNVTGF